MSAHPAAGFGVDPTGSERTRLLPEARRAMDWPGTRPRRWFVGKYTICRRPGSVLAQRLVGAPLPLVKCNDYTRKVVGRVSTMPEHPDGCPSSEKTMGYVLV